MGIKVREFRNRHRIETGAAERMTARQPASGKERPSPGAVRRHSLDGVGRARRLEPAGSTDEWRQHYLVDANQEDDELGRHCFDRLNRLSVVL